MSRLDKSRAKFVSAVVNTYVFFALGIKRYRQGVINFFKEAAFWIAWASLTWGLFGFSKKVVAISFGLAIFTQLAITFWVTVYRIRREAIRRAVDSR